MRATSLRLFAFAVLLAAPRLRAQTSAAAEPVVTLPAYNVSESLIVQPPEPWRYGRRGDFEFFSNASDTATTRFADRLSRFQGVFRELFPLAKTVPALPVTVVLCGAGDKFAALTPPSGPANVNTASASFFAADADQAVIVIDLQSQELDLNQPGAISSTTPGVDPTADNSNVPGAEPSTNGGVVVNHEQLILRGYIHSILARVSPRPPPWFAEGLAQLYSRLDISTDAYRFAKFDDAFGGFFQQRQILPLAQLFAVGYNSQEFLQPINGSFPAESLAFVHLCLYGSNQRYRQPLLEFVSRLNREPPSEKLFEEIFHKSYVSMATIIRAYVDAGSYAGAEVAFPKPVELPAFTLRDATDAEVGRIKGDTLRLAGRLSEARAQLLSPYQRKHTDPRLLAAIALLDRTEQNTAVAERYLALSTQAGVELPGAYVYLAQLRLAAQTANDHPLTDSQVAELLRLLAAAHAHPPLRADLFRTVADVWLHSATVPKPENLLALNEGVRAFPGDADLVHTVARAKLRAGATADATSLANLGLRFAHDDATRARFQQLLATLPPAPKKQGS
jgi:hypothetical protein